MESLMLLVHGGHEARARVAQLDDRRVQSVRCCMPLLLQLLQLWPNWMTCVYNPCAVACAWLLGGCNMPLLLQLQLLSL